MLFETGRDGSVVFELVEEAFNQVSEAIKERTEGWNVDTSGRGFDVGPGAAFGEGAAQEVTIVGAIGDQDLSLADCFEEFGSAPSVMSLPLREFERDGIAIGIDERVDLGRQPAPRAPHASGCREVPSGGAFLWTPLLPLAAC